MCRHSLVLGAQSHPPGCGEPGSGSLASPVPSGSTAPLFKPVWLMGLHGPLTGLSFAVLIHGSPLAWRTASSAKCSGSSCGVQNYKHRCPPHTLLCSEISKCDVCKEPSIQPGSSLPLMGTSVGCSVGLGCGTGWVWGTQTGLGYSEGELWLPVLGGKGGWCSQRSPCCLCHPKGCLPPRTQCASIALPCHPSHSTH